MQSEDEGQQDQGQQDQGQQDQGQQDQGQQDQGQQDQGAGSKAAILTDLHDERAKRQQLQKDFETFKAGMANAFGVQKDAELTPEQMAQQVAEATARSNKAEQTLSVYQRAGQTGVNPEALLDSASFLTSISSLDPGDVAALDAAIQAAIERNPSLKPTPSGAGWGDAVQGNKQPIASDEQAALNVLGFGNP